MVYPLALSKKPLAEYGQVPLQEIEHLWYSLKPPYEALFSWLEKKENKPINKELLFFHPVMLSHPLEEKELDKINPEVFSFERKYDGIRVQAAATENEKALFTRTGDDISHSFPDALEPITGSVVLDGELIIITNEGVASFNQLQQRLNRKSLTKKLVQELPAGIILYDILSLNGTDLRDLPFRERRHILEDWHQNQSAPNLLLSDLLTLGKEQTLIALVKT